MQDVRVAKRYAGAVFAAARSAGLIKEVEEDLKSVVGVVRSDSRFRDFLLSPEVHRDAKREILDNLFASRVCPLSMDFLRLLLAKRREDVLPAALVEYESLRRDHEKVIYAKISSATPLTSQQREALLAKLTQQIGKTLEPEFLTDPTLIGGVRVSYENMVLDGSVRGGLGRLRDTLRHDLLKQA